MARWAYGAVFLPRDVRLLLVKDFRLFRRDPVQWSQFLIFFGLLALYFSQIRRFSYHQNYSAMIGFLNLAVVGLILSTFTTRFIFPMVSLEGRRLWILGLLPISRDSVLWAKFLFAAVGSLIPCTLLVLLSDLMLQIQGKWILMHQVSCVVLVRGAFGNCRRIGGENAGPAGTLAIENRRRFWRHAESGDQCRVHRRGRAADRAARASVFGVAARGSLVRRRIHSLFGQPAWRSAAAFF